MPIAEGDRIPDVEIKTPTAEGPASIRTGEALGHGKVVLFAVPGAFTPTCSDHHLPGFVLRAEELKAKGVDTIACVSVNDAFVMDAWARDRQVDGKVLMLADGNGDFTEAMGLTLDGSGFGMGRHSRRYAVIIEEGVVRSLFLEPGAGLEASSAEAVLAAL